MSTEHLIYLVSIAILWAAIGFSLVSSWRFRRFTRRSRAEFDERIAVLDAVKRARDPGRAVHERLAAALEPGIVRDQGPADGQPAIRRAAAMETAAWIIETCRTASIELIDAGQEDA